uniref:FLYWCH-type domain-containing protein n=1 Tax=Ciona savignyi TaxID=51511 RepID=H2YQ22_CIOSA
MADEIGPATNSDSVSLEEDIIDAEEHIDEGVEVSSSLTSEDVNNMSLSIWKDIKLIQESFTSPVLEALISKILKMFDVLDTLIKSYQMGKTDSKFLNPTIEKLKLELKLNDEKHQEEVSAIKAAWKEDINEWKESMELVQEDNQRLALMLTDKLEVCIETNSPIVDTEGERDQMDSDCNELNDYLESASFQTELNAANPNFQVNDTDISLSDDISSFQNLDQPLEMNHCDPFLPYPETGYTFNEYFAQPTNNLNQRKMNGVHRKLKFVVVPGKTIHNQDKLHDSRGYSYKVKSVTTSGYIKWKCMCKRTMCKAVVKERDGVYKFGNCEHNHKAVPRNKQAIIAQIKRSQIKTSKRRRQLKRLQKMERSLDPDVFNNLDLEYPEYTEHLWEPTDIKPIKDKKILFRGKRRIDTTVTRISIPGNCPLQTSKMENEVAIFSLN